MSPRWRPSARSSAARPAVRRGRQRQDRTARRDVPARRRRRRVRGVRRPGEAVRGGAPRHRHHRRRVRVGRARPSPCSSPAAACPTCSRCRSPTRRRCSRTTSSWTSPTRWTTSATPTASTRSSSTPSPATTATSTASRARPTRTRLHVQPRAVRGGRPRPRQPAHDVGRGARVRQEDPRRDRQGRLLADGDQQHRRLAADRAAPSRAAAARRSTTRTAPPSRRSTTTPPRPCCSSCTT